MNWLSLVGALLSLLRTLAHLSDRIFSVARERRQARLSEKSRAHDRLLVALRARQAAGRRRVDLGSPDKSGVHNGADGRAGGLLDRKYRRD